MPRKSRENSGTGIYHVMLRGINRQNIFYDIDDYECFLDLLRRQINPIDDNNKYLPSRCTVYASCPMPNQVHPLIREKDDSLATVMKSIGVGYAWHYNKKYQHLGPVFQDRFRSEPVNDENYFMLLLRYIHQNPVKAGLVKVVDEYTWSSWREYEGVHCICSTQPVISRMPFEELKALVFEPLPKMAVVLDIDNERRRKTDEEVGEYIISSFGLRHAQDVLLLTKERQKDFIRQARDFGASIRQIERLTGISFSIICRN